MVVLTDEKGGEEGEEVVGNARHLHHRGVCLSPGGTEWKRL